MRTKEEIIKEITEWVNQVPDDKIRGYMIAMDTSVSVRSLHSDDVDQARIKRAFSNAFQD